MGNKFILSSSKNKYNDHINKIINEADYKIHVTNDLNDINIDSVIYSLITNYDFRVDISKYNKFINNNFFIRNLNKKDIQLLLKDNGINTPNIYSKIEQYPVYVKENKHEGLVNLINDSSEYVSENSYAEEYIEYDKEDKYYYVFGKVYDTFTEISDEFIIELCCKIVKILSLDVMSIDVLYKDDKYYVIDVNHSPGFYKSDIARKELIRKIKEM